jgi:SAM-dependent methyltransferase
MSHTDSSPTRQPVAGAGEPAPAGIEDRATVMRVMFGAWLQQALYVAAKLDVADALAGGELEIRELADRVGADPPALARFLRGLASAGVFTEPRRDVFALNGPAHYLRADTESTHKYITILHGEEAYAACAEALHTARTGNSAFEKVYGMPYFRYLDQNPDARAAFDAAMGRETAAPAVVSRCRFPDEGTIVDVGGGTGMLLSSVLEARLLLRGVLFDLPASAREARRALARAGLDDRVRVVSGDAAEAVPGGGDVYTICRVLHDFDDDQALSVLRAIRRAMTESARLIVFDALRPDRPGFNPGRLADLGMLMVLGGQFRTEAEMRELITCAGFRVTDVRHAVGGDPRAESALEAVPV